MLKGRCRHEIIVQSEDQAAPQLIGVLPGSDIVNSENQGIPRSRLAAAVIVSLLIGGTAGYLIGTSGGWGEPEPKTGKIRGLKCVDGCEAYIGNDKLEGYCYCQNVDKKKPCYKKACVDDALVSDKPTSQQK